eukprot:scaffold7825_cov162-Amphora_coffeaeformis.AAC.1
MWKLIQRDVVSRIKLQNSSLIPSRRTWCSNAAHLPRSSSSSSSSSSSKNPHCRHLGGGSDTTTTIRPLSSAFHPNRQGNKRVQKKARKQREWRPRDTNYKGRRNEYEESVFRQHELSKILSSALPNEADSAASSQPSATPRKTVYASNRVDPEIQKRRQEAALVVMYFLKGGVQWRQGVIDMLRDSLNSEGGPSSKKVAWIKEAQQWYNGSLSSFLERLTGGDHPASVGGALDRMADVGFADKDFQQKFRAISGYRYDVSRISSEIMQQEQECEMKASKIQVLKKQAEEIQEKLDEFVPKPDTSSTDDDSKPFWKVAVDSVTGLFSPRDDETKPTPEPNEEVRFPPEVFKEAKPLVRQLERKKRFIESSEIHLKDARIKLEHLRENRRALKEPMANEIYNQATKVIEGVREDICRFLAEHVAERHRLILERYQVLDERTDLTRPHEWFPHARLDRRKIIFHAGPTNSGKTYQALERLREAKRGLYLGPLRLLAAEVYETLTADGVYCNLYTGQEKREIPFATHATATMEMASVLDDFDVIVIDEIQMIADLERGYAWTRALIGSRCKEIHVCGGAEAEPILKKLAAACGDELEIKRYKRFSPLTVERKSLAKSADQLEAYRNVQKGDCVVAFSRDDIFAIKREIENLTDFKCCIIYGSLPPQTRSSQARLFNDPDSGYDILVATDAIGMGLNLNIRRIVFNSMYKNDGQGIVQLGHSAVKQISGRAGRRNSVFPTGYITCRCPEDMTHLNACMATDIEPIQRAGLLPTASHFETFEQTLQEYGKQVTKNSMYTILRQFGEMASIRNDYFLCRQEGMHEIAKGIDQYPLTVRGKYALCMCPVSTNNAKSMDVLKRFAAKLSAGEVSGLPNRMIVRQPKTFEDLAQLCGIFSDLDLFLWLQNKFPPGNYIEQQNAAALKETAIRMIGEALERTSKLKLKHCYVTRDKRVRATWKQRRERKTARNELALDQRNEKSATNDDDEEEDPDWDRIAENA